MTAPVIRQEYGFDINEIIEKTKEIYPPKGRCQTKEVKWFCRVDYAHTPDAVEK